jgi:hypothetical protein
MDTKIFLDTSIISPWKLILNDYVNDYGNLELVLRCNFEEKELTKYLPPFYT